MELEVHQLTSLPRLFEGLENLTVFGRGLDTIDEFPVSLRRLELRDCIKLKELTIPPHLSYLDITGCFELINKLKIPNTISTTFQCIAPNGNTFRHDTHSQQPIAEQAEQFLRDSASERAAHMNPAAQAAPSNVETGRTKHAAAASGKSKTIELNKLISAHLDELKSAEGTSSNGKTLHLDGGQDFVMMEDFNSNLNKNWCAVPRDDGHAHYDLILENTAKQLKGQHPATRRAFTEDEVIRGNSLANFFKGAKSRLAPQDPSVAGQSVPRQPVVAAVEPPAAPMPSAQPAPLIPALQVADAEPSVEIAQATLPASGPLKTADVNRLISNHVDEMKAGWVSNNGTILHLDDGQDCVALEAFEDNLNENWCAVPRDDKHYDLVLETTLPQLNGKSPMSRRPFTHDDIIRGDKLAELFK